MIRSVLLFAGAALCASAASAADHLEFAPAPSWVVPQKIPQAADAAKAPVAVLLNDKQVRLEPGRMISFIEVATKVQTADGLAAGSISLPWQPSTDTITVNKLHIIRDGKVIDVLKSGQTFTVLRRETNLEAATLDGSLTATIQPEGLQVGDIIDLAITDVHVDPVLEGHLEQVFGGWNGVPIDLAHFRLSWPTAMQLSFRQSDALPKPQRSSEGGFDIYELSERSIEPLIMPKGAPARFRLGRFGEVTDYQSWSDISDLMRPLYDRAAVIPSSGSLREEVERIRSSANTSKQKAEMAVRLVEERVRYVALEMGTGGLVPANAETTWSRRFGDCKGKTALLLALLHELGIDAEAVLVHHSLGDILPGRLPMVGYFDHVIVRAHVDGKAYWLDGTRTGDTALDRIPVPQFEWGLPLVQYAKLEAITPKPLTNPQLETRVSIDAHDGAFAPAAFKANQLFRGDAALGLKAMLAGFSAAQKKASLEDYWKNKYDYVDIAAVDSAFDAEKTELRLTMSGSANLDWDDGWFYVPGSTIGYKADFSRPDGPHHDAPFNLSYPDWNTTLVTVRLPDAFDIHQTKLPPPVKETLAGVQYARDVRLDGSLLTVQVSARTRQAELSYKDALAAQPRLRALYDEDVYLRLPGGYQATSADLAALPDRKPASASEFVSRGNLYLDAGKTDEAIADFTKAIALDSRNAWAFADRGIAHVWNRQYGEAEQDFAATDKIDPDNEVASRGRGLMAEFNGNFDEAVRAFSRSLSEEPQNTFALSHRASSFLAGGKPEQALKDYDTILEIDPANTTALTGRANVYRSTGDEEKALADVDAALAGGNRDPQLRLLRANILRSQGKHDLVLREAKLLEEENPDSGFALVAAGKIYSSEGRPEQAIKAIDCALALHPYAYIYINRAQVRSRTDYAGKMADLDQALKLEPNSADALAAKAQLMFNHSKYPEAVALYDRALETIPGESRIPLMRAVALYKAGRTAEAEQILADEQAKAKTPAAFNQLCWVEATAGVLLDSALDACREAVKLEPETAGYKDSLGMVLLRLGKLDESIQEYTAAIEKAHLAASYMGRAIAYARAGDMTRARADRSEALKSDADIEARFLNYGLALEQSQNNRVSR